MKALVDFHSTGMIFFLSLEVRKPTLRRLFEAPHDIFPFTEKSTFIFFPPLLFCLSHWFYNIYPIQKVYSFIFHPLSSFIFLIWFPVAWASWGALPDVVLKLSSHTLDNSFSTKTMKILESEQLGPLKLS